MVARPINKRYDVKTNRRYENLSDFLSDITASMKDNLYVFIKHVNGNTIIVPN